MADSKRSTKKKGKKSKTKAAKAEENKQETNTEDPEELKGDEGAIFKYMKEANRPYSVQNIFDNLRGEIKKAQCQKVLDSLTERGKLQAKDFGKAKIYLVNQSIMPEADEGELQQLESEIQEKSSELSTLTTELKQLQAQYKEITSAMTTEQLISEVQNIKESIEILNLELFTLKEQEPASEQDLKKAEDTRVRFLNEMNRRRRLCNEMISTLCEFMDMKPKELKNTIGIEDVKD
jgi:26S proteasome regulatory subunit (ATPase 3-interacting protein)